MSEHAPKNPSGMARRVQCPGSDWMQALYPEPEGPEAIEGQAAHWVMAELLADRVVSTDQVTPQGVLVTQEMIDGGDMVCEIVGNMRAHVETRVYCRGLHPDCWGTPDVFFQPMSRRVVIVDYKFGHEFVEVFQNRQLVTYAHGVLNATSLLSIDDALIDFYIVQPRSYHPRGEVRKWSTTVAALRPLWDSIRVACDESDKGPQARTQAGPECKHCTARHACPTLQSAALSVVDVAGKAEPLNLPSRDAGHELKRLQWAISLAQARASGLEQQLLAAMKRGEGVPGWHVEHGTGREVWSVPLSQVFALGAMYGKELSKPSAITPKQAREKGITVPATMTTTGTGEAKLVADEPHIAARIFGGTHS